MEDSAINYSLDHRFGFMSDVKTDKTEDFKRERPTVPVKKSRSSAFASRGELNVPFM